MKKITILSIVLFCTTMMFSQKIELDFKAENNAAMAPEINAEYSDFKVYSAKTKELILKDKVISIFGCSSLSLSEIFPSFTLKRKTQSSISRRFNFPSATLSRKASIPCSVISAHPEIFKVSKSGQSRANLARALSSIRVCSKLA